PGAGAVARPRGFSETTDQTREAMSRTGFGPADPRYPALPPLAARQPELGAGRLGPSGSSSPVRIGGAEKRPGPFRTSESGRTVIDAATRSPANARQAPPVAPGSTQSGSGVSARPPGTSGPSRRTWTATGSGR